MRFFSNFLQRLSTKKQRNLNNKELNKVIPPNQNMDNYIKGLIKEYMIFMGIQDFPNICPKFSPCNNYDAAFVRSEDIQTQDICLYYTENFLDLSDDEKNSTIYHELTHIYDAHTLFKDIEDKHIFNKIMSSYSEFHAEKIAFMKLCGIPSVTDLQYISMDKEVFCYGEKMSISKLCLVTLAISLEYIKDTESLKEKSTEEIALIRNLTMKRILYYLGSMKFLQEHSERQFIMKFSLYGDFTENILALYNILCVYDKDHKLEDIEVVISEYQKLNNALISYFVKNQYSE